jgi:MFS family permease
MPEKINIKPGLSLYPYFIYLSMFFLMIPHSAATPVTVLFANSLNASYMEIGLISAVFSVAPLLLVLQIGKLVDRYGTKLPLFWGSLGMFISLILPYLFPELNVLVLTRLLTGAAQSVAVVALQNGAAASVDRAHRERSVTNFSLFASAGLFVGPLAGGYLVEVVGFQWSYFILGCIALLPMLLSQFVKESHSPSENLGGTSEEIKPKIMKEIFKNNILLRAMIISMVSLVAADLFAVYFPLLGSASGLTALEIGWIIAVEGLAYVLVRFFMPVLIVRFGRGNMLFGLLFFSGLAFALMPFFNQFYVFALLSMILGFGLGMTMPITIMLAYNYAPLGRTAEVLSLRIASNRLAQLLLPIILSVISLIGGLVSIFIINGLMLLIASLTAKGIPAEEERDSSL